MENINEIDLEKYCNWFFDIAETVESGSLVLLAHKNNIVRYTGVIFYLTNREKEQKSPKHEVYENLICKAMNIIKDVKKDIDQLNEVLTRYSGKIGKALNYAFPNADERDFILSHRKDCFDVDLESYESDLKAKPLPKERIIKDFLGTRKYINLDFYVSGEPLRSVQDNDDFRLKVLAEFAQDLATYDFIKYLNNELLEEQTGKVEVVEVLNLPAKMLLLEKLRFFELPIIKEKTPSKASKLISKLLNVNEREVRRYYNGEITIKNKSEYEKQIELILSSI